MYSVVMVVAMAGAPEAPACCPTICCPKICLPEIHCPKLCCPTFHCPTFHCPQIHCPTFCCKPACPTPCAAPCPPPCPAPCAPTCAPSHGCCLTKCFSHFNICGWGHKSCCGDSGYGWSGAAPAPGCGQTVIPPTTAAPAAPVAPPATVPAK